VGSQQSWSKEGTVRYCQSKEASILWSHHEETRKLPGERNNARTMPGVRRRGRPCTAWIDNIMDRTLCGRVNQNERIEINGESMFMVWPILGSRTAKEQNRTARAVAKYCDEYVCEDIARTMHNLYQIFCACCLRGSVAC